MRCQDCRNQCLEAYMQRHPSITIPLLYRYYIKGILLSESEQWKLCEDALNGAIDVDGYFTSFRHQGMNNLCRYCWALVAGISRTAMTRRISEFNQPDGRDKVRKKVKREQPRTDELREWFFRLIRERGLPLSDQVHQKTKQTKYHLPAGHRVDYYLLYADSTSTPVTVRWFYQVWDKEFPHVVVPRHHRLGIMTRPFHLW